MTHLHTKAARDRHLLVKMCVTEIKNTVTLEKMHPMMETLAEVLIFLYY